MTKYKSCFLFSFFYPCFCYSSMHFISIRFTGLTRICAHISVQLSWVSPLRPSSLSAKVMNSCMVCLLKILPGELGFVYRFMGKHIKTEYLKSRKTKKKSSLKEHGCNITTVLAFSEGVNHCKGFHSSLSLSRTHNTHIH